MIVVRSTYVLPSYSFCNLLYLQIVWKQGVLHVPRVMLNLISMNGIRLTTFKSSLGAFDVSTVRAKQNYVVHAHMCVCVSYTLFLPKKTKVYLYFKFKELFSVCVLWNGYSSTVHLSRSSHLPYNKLYYAYGLHENFFF